MPKVIITNVPTLDGEYPLALPFTIGEYGILKRRANVRANELMEALGAGDVEVVAAMASIALTRAGKPHLWEQLAASVPGEITFDVSDLEGDAGPPPQAASGESGSDTSAGSGNGLRNGMDTYPETSPALASGIPQPVST